MKRKENAGVFYAGILLVIFLMSGCKAPADSSLPTSLPIVVFGSPSPQTHVSVTPTQKPLITLTMGVPSITTSIPTNQATSTSTTIPEISWTPHPTLLPDEKKAMILDLFSHNANCSLPCWWGVVPGETLWTEARQFLMPVSKNVLQGEVGHFTKDTTDYSITNFSVSYEVANYSDDGLTHFAIVNDIVNAIWILPRGTEQNYQVHQILKAYGPPTKVLVEVDIDYRVFHLFISYPEIGIMALYEGKIKTDASDYAICPQQIGPELWLWTPEKFLSPQGNDPIEPEIVYNMKIIEDASDLTNQGFFQVYQQADAPCFKTPSNLWGAP